MALQKYSTMEKFYIICFVTPDPSVISSTPGLIGEVDHSSAKRHLQFKKNLQFESLSYKVRFKARFSKHETGDHAQNVSLYSHTCPCVRCK